MSATLTDDRTTLLNSPNLEHSRQRSEDVLHSPQTPRHLPNAWSRSLAKRCFDALAVIVSLPLALPLLGTIGICVSLNSRGSALFVQMRIGKDGVPFKIYKFRTMVQRSGVPRPSVTTIGNQEFTPVGPFLRKWKLDELPQLFNVLCGDMTLVGPRPKMPEHQSGLLLCRPGITGAATLAFGREEFLLAGVPQGELNDFVRDVVNPLKNRMDGEYMSRASFISDLTLIIKSAFRIWPNGCLELAGLESWPGMPHRSFPPEKPHNHHSSHKGTGNVPSISISSPLSFEMEGQHEGE